MKFWANLDYIFPSITCNRGTCNRGRVIGITRNALRRAFLVEILRPLHFLVDYIGNGPKKCNGRLAKNHFLCDVMDNGVVQVIGAR